MNEDLIKMLAKLLDKVEAQDKRIAELEARPIYWHGGWPQDVGYGCPNPPWWDPANPTKIICGENTCVTQ